VFALLLPAAFVAGVIDAIGGGGGLITVPALLAAGLPPHLALGTNKGQAVIGSGAALFRYSRAGLVHGERARIAFPCGLIGSVLGVQLVMFIAPATLRPIVLGLLVLVAVLLLIGPDRFAAHTRVHVRHEARAAALIALGLGAYDGFFGPGVGTFLIFAFVLCFGSELTRASADAKVVNFASNLAALVAFSLRGAVELRIALPMAAAQLAGSLLGAHLAVRGGERFVRAVVLAIVVALVTKLALDLRG
jgi:hypothetical protein